MHVLQVVGNSDLGIAENHVFQLATALKARGVRVDVVCPRPGPLTDRLQRAGIEPIVVSGASNPTGRFGTAPGRLGLHR